MRSLTPKLVLAASAIAAPVLTVLPAAAHTSLVAHGHGEPSTPTGLVVLLVLAGATGLLMAGGVRRYRRDRAGRWR